MKKVMRKILGMAFKSTVLALTTKLMLKAVEKLRTPSTSQRVDEIIDKKADKAKELAKAAAHKSIDTMDQVVKNIDKTDIKETVNKFKSESQKTS